MLGGRTFLADGEIQLLVEKVEDKDILRQVIAGGELRSRKGIAIPGLQLNVGIPTEKDMIDLKFGVDLGIDWVEQSFIRETYDVKSLRLQLKKLGHKNPIIVKLEKQEALSDLDGIIQSADGVMIARGDLGLEVPLQDVPNLQKEIIQVANSYGKPVITATQMLESMIYNPTSTRAEVTDIANAIHDGISSVMLSVETAIGRYPVESVTMMTKVEKSTEDCLDYVTNFRSKSLVIKEGLPDAVGNDLSDSNWIFTYYLFTDLGKTVWNVSKGRSRALIAVASSNQETLRKCLLY